MDLTRVGKFESLEVSVLHVVDEIRARATGEVDVPPEGPLIIVDFSYPRAIMERLPLDTVVLDHHKTAEANCAGLLNLPFLTFDMNRSGAGLAWDRAILRRHEDELVRTVRDVGERLPDHPCRGKAVVAVRMVDHANLRHDDSLSPDRGQSR